MASIILLGNLSDGFRAVGPFVDHDEAMVATPDGWIMTLEPPERPPAGPLTLDEIGSATVCPRCGRILRTWTDRNFEGYEIEHSPSHGANNVCEECL